MSLGVLNNIAAIYAQNNLNQTQNSLQNVLQQLSSGSRINSGADDAAGLALADGLHANEAALTQSSQNATSGVGLLQTADGALSQVTNLLNRAVTLATEAANGTLNSSQIGSANQEYQNILTEIGNIGSTTNFNGNNVFTNTATNVFVSDGTASGATTFQELVGSLSDASVGTSTATTTAGTTTAITNPTPTVPTATTSGTATFGFSSAADTVSGTLKIAVGAGGAVTENFATGTTLAEAVGQLNDDVSFRTAGLVASQSPTSPNNLIITGPTGVANTLTLTGTALSDTTASVTTPGAGVNLAGTSLTSASASAVLTNVTNALQDVAYQRGNIGASINELNAASNVASAESVNLTSAEDSVRSTNYGQATSSMASLQVLSQTGISALAQANSVQQEILKLLQ
ncbi:flagellin N-terminal helical domain-containing protein [Edaphobacter dinghuensis]|uniref:Flagellin n=1 Tax=Edaphobacter dinghuensis TaxID=1560005 RepID=A0A917HKD4_9BACT|nr:flagellin [Edaphobacter dinghuensis]GGG81888.1 flagellin A [Edaphobacter dinghuensis]